MVSRFYLLSGGGCRGEGCREGNGVTLDGA